MPGTNFTHEPLWVVTHTAWEIRGDNTLLTGFQLCARLGSAILIGHFMHAFKSRFISWGVTLFARVKGHAFSSSVIGYFFVVPLTRIVPVFFFSVPKISNISRKLSQVSRIPAKSPDSRKNFVFLPKQTLLELSPPVDITSRKK